MPSPSSSFTIKSPSGLLRMLISDVNILTPGKSNHSAIKAIWDTGATGSTISKNIAQQLGLIQTGFAIVNTANGTVTLETFTVDIRLPNGFLIEGVLVSAVDKLTAGCDALIGMDIITLGDFSITNHKGNTCMSFRFPSCHEVDFVENPNYGITPIRKPMPGSKRSNITLPKKKRK